MASHLSPLEALASKPRPLEGGGELSATPLDERHALVRLQYGSTAVDLLAAYLSVPYPSGLRRLAAREPGLEAVVVDRIPPGLAEAASTAGIAILDRHGYGRVVRPGFVYVAAPPPRLGPRPVSSRSPFAPKASRIVRMLLANPLGRWRLSSIADIVQIDPGNTHRVLASLLETGTVERDEDEYIVTDPGSLLEAWADSTRLPREQVRLPIAGTLASTIRDLLVVLDDSAVVSGELAAELLAPYLPAQSAVLHCFRREAWERLGQDAGAEHHRPPSDAQVGQLLVTFADEGVAQFHSTADGLPLAHPAQVYVDLSRARGRGREAAEHLRRELLGY